MRPRGQAGPLNLHAKVATYQDRLQIWIATGTFRQKHTLRDRSQHLFAQICFAEQRDNQHLRRWQLSN